MPSAETAILLCGGLGTRLRSLFPDKPKALAPILGKPFIEHQIRWLHSLGVNHVHIAAGYMAESIEQWFSEHDLSPINVTFSRETQPLGTGGAIKFAVRFVPESPHYLVLNGDTLLPHLSIHEIRKEHHRGSHALTMAVTSIPDATRYGTVKMNADNVAESFLEKSNVAGAGYVNGGVYCIRKPVLELIPDNAACSLENVIFPELVRSGDIKCVIVPPPLLDMGTPEGHASMSDFIKNRVDRV